MKNIKELLVLMIEKGKYSAADKAELLALVESPDAGLLPAWDSKRKAEHSRKMREHWAKHKVEATFLLETSGHQDRLITGWELLAKIVGRSIPVIRQKISKGGGVFYFTDKDGDNVKITRKTWAKLDTKSDKEPEKPKPPTVKKKS